MFSLVERLELVNVVWKVGYRGGMLSCGSFPVLSVKSLIFFQNGVFLAPVMSVPFLLFSGFFVSFDAIPIYLRWITYLSYIRYGFEGTALATYGFDRPKLQCFVSYCHFKAPTTTLEELDMINSSYTVDIVALVAIFFILRIAAFLFLKFKLKANRWFRVRRLVEVGTVSKCKCVEIWRLFSRQIWNHNVTTLTRVIVDR